MSNNIKLKIDVTKIDKNRLFTKTKNGAKYLDAVLIETPNGQYSDFMIVESITKEEREAGKKGTIIGNGDFFQQRPKDEAEPIEEIQTSDLNSGQNDLPF
jgi:hypothetical protein